MWRAGCRTELAVSWRGHMNVGVFSLGCLCGMNMGEGMDSRDTTEMSSMT